jgi:hypothetical protein
MILNKTFISMSLILAIICIVIFIMTINSAAKQVVEVKIVDYHTLKPIKNAQVLVAQSGIGFIGGRFVWGQYYKYTAATNSDGTIHAKNLSDDSVFIRVDHNGYISLLGTYPIKTIITLKLKQKSKDYVALPWGNLEIGVENGRPFGWIFTKKRKTFEPDEADIFPEIVNGSLYITAAKGINFLSKETINATSSLLIYTDTAPYDGYVSKEKLDLKSTSGVYFVITQDKNYAKFLFDSYSGYTSKGSIKNFHGNNWALLLKYVFNPDGSRNLPYQ